VSSGDHQQPDRPRTLGDVRLSIALGILGFGVVAAGSLGPWVTVAFASVSGTRGDGKATLIAAGVGIALLVFGRGSGGSMVTAGVVAVVAAGIAGYDVVHISQATANLTLFGYCFASPGWGVYVAFGGALGTLFALVSDSSRDAREVVATLAVIAAVAVLVVGPPQRSSATSTSATSTSANQPSGPTLSSSSTQAAVSTVPTVS
jgi:DMSO reductase anchor subunit